MKISYNESVLFYYKAKEFNTNEDYRSALIYLRLALESVTKIKIKSTPKFAYKDTQKVNTKILCQIFGGFGSEVKDLKSACNSVSFKSNSAAHFNLLPNSVKSANYNEIVLDYEMYYKVAELDLLKVFDKIDVTYDNKLMLEEITGRKKTLITDYGLEKDKNDNASLEILKKLYDRLKTSGVLSNSSNGPNDNVNFFRFISRTVDSVQIALEIAVKFNETTMKYGGNAYGIAIQILLLNGAPAERENLRNIITSNFENLNILLEFDWELYEKVESSRATVRAKIALFLPLEIEEENLVFNDQENVLDLVSDTFIKVAEMVNEIE